MEVVLVIKKAHKSFRFNFAELGSGYNTYKFIESKILVSLLFYS